MKILLDLQGAQSESRYRGIGRYTRAFARALIEGAGEHEVHLLLNGALRANMTEMLDEFGPLVPRERIHVFAVPTPIKAVERTNEWRARAAALIRESVIEGLRPDILHVPSLFEGFVDDSIVSIGELDGDHATVVTLHDLVPLRDPARYLANPEMETYYLWHTKHLKRADLLISVSDYSKKEAHELLGIPLDTIEVVLSGVEPIFSPGRPTEAESALTRLRFKLPERFVLHVGALDPRKNAQALIAAFALLPRSARAGRKLVFAGRLSDHERALVGIAAGRHGLLAQDIVFTDYVEEDELVMLYRLCEVLVFPSLHEGFGLPALEAMACGAPVLAADNTSLPEVVGRADALFDPFKPATLAAILARVFGERAFHEDLKRWGPKRASQFTWAGAARQTIRAFERVHAARAARSRPASRRPTMAFVSPLPNDKTGIATYSAELLPELARFYDIECIIKDTVVTDKWILSNTVRRDLGWFERNAYSYDRIVYSMGNSSYHAHMFAMMRRFPGVVIMHDAFLSNLVEWMCGNNLVPWEEFDREVYRSHGLEGLALKRDGGIPAVVDALPMNGGVVRDSLGIIVHSRHALDLIAAAHGAAAAAAVTMLPHLRAPMLDLDRASARSRLGIRADTLVVCSFGLVTTKKLGRLLYDAWVAAGLHEDPTRQLVFVGGLNDDYARALQAEARTGASNVVFTDHASDRQYADYLRAADAAVQLRRKSRGETSGAIIDCMAVGLPVIVNAHGSASEVPRDCVLMLDEEPSVADIAAKLAWIVANPDRARALGARAKARITADHHPTTIGERIHEAIERFHEIGPMSREKPLLAKIAAITVETYPTAEDRTMVAKRIAVNRPRIGKAQILYDVTVLAEQDANTGIQRVVRSMLKALIEHPVAGYRVEPVVIAGHRPVYARRFSAERLDLHCGGLADDDVEYSAGDIYLQVDWVPDRLVNIQDWLGDFRRAGGEVTIVIHDLLPLELPKVFPEWMEGFAWAWFKVVLTCADKIACVSRTVSDDVLRYGKAMDIKRRTPVAVSHFRNGSDLKSSSPASETKIYDSDALAKLSDKPTFLMVGTIEPRKGHVQVLEAMDLLWSEGVDVNLVIVGKLGWMTEEVAARIKGAATYDKKLFWFERASDAVLERLYQRSTALISASLGEGFGLPLVEAAAHGIPIITRDLPVFREVCGVHAFYFAGADARSLADSLTRWLALFAAGEAPSSTGMPSHGWPDATRQLMDIVLGRGTYRYIKFAEDPKAATSVVPARLATAAG